VGPTRVLLAGPRGDRDVVTLTRTEVYRDILQGVSLPIRRRYMGTCYTPFFSEITGTVYTLKNYSPAYGWLIF
jgi:hypothetical protein